MSNSKKRRTDAKKMLTPVDRMHLSQLRRCRRLLRDKVRSVAMKYKTGVYLVGRPGTGKTWLVNDALEKCDATAAFCKGHVTPVGLFRVLERHQDSVIVVDDAPCLFNKPLALQLLMAALDGEAGKPRLISYDSHRFSERVNFSGGIVAISNVALSADPLASAVQSRIELVDFEPTTDELIAFMRLLANEGFEGLSLHASREVAEFLIQESKDTNCILDLRALPKAIQDRRQFDDGHAECSWQDLVRASLRKPYVSPAPFRLTKKQELELDRQKLLEAIEKYPGNRQRQLAESGLRKTKFGRLLREITLADKTGTLCKPATAQ